MSEKRKAKAKPETFVRVTCRTEEDGITVFTDPNGIDVAWKLPRGGVVDLRVEPPYLSMSPCPYCGAVNDVGHFPAGHVHSYLGEKV